MKHFRVRLPAAFTIALLLGVVTAHPSKFDALLRRGAPDPTDPSWIKDFAALGDSYAAGIGAATGLTGNGDASCSRYDGAYGVLMQGLFDGKPKFQFVACSGDKSSQVKEQVKALADNSQDLVTISAGGNDALLSDVLKNCIYTPAGEKACNQAIDATRKAIDNDVQNNIDDLLEELAPKLRGDGIVVYTLYAQFFNADTDACSSQTWNWFQGVIPGSSGVKLTKDLRKSLNGLVVAANDKIKGAIASAGSSTRPSKLNIAVVDWDEAVGINHGRFCEEGSKDDPNDPSNANLIFQRLNTAVQFVPPDKKLADTKQEKTPRRRGVVQDVGRLEKRLPDDIERVFHPTVLGQQVLAAFAMDALIDAKVKAVGGTPTKSCSKPPSNDKPPTCHASSNQGIDKTDFEEARDAWCKDTSKPLDKSKKYVAVFSFDLKKNDGGTCAQSDCVDTVNKLWNTCADYASRPDGDNGPLKGHNGPLRGDGTATTACGTYSFKLADPKPTPAPNCGQKQGQAACAGTYKVHFKQYLGGKDPDVLITYDVTDDGTQKSLGSGLLTTPSGLLFLGGQDNIYVYSKDSKKKDTPLSFQLLNSQSGKKSKTTYAEDDNQGNMFHCDPATHATVDGNPGPSRLLDCWFNVNEIVVSK